MAISQTQLPIVHGPFPFLEQEACPIQISFSYTHVPAFF